MTVSSLDSKSLRKTYCPPLDESLVLAIASDYDLTDRENQTELVELLNGLKEDALIHEAVDTESIKIDSSLKRHDQASENTSETASSSHNVTSATSELNNLNLHVNGDALGEELEHLPDGEKKNYLKELFPGMEAARIHDILANAGSLRVAIDELLNIAFIKAYGEDYSDTEQRRVKGIEGFAEELRPNRGRKRRNNKSKRTTDSSRTTSANSYRAQTPPATNVWSSASADVEFICSRTTLSRQAVTSIYHHKGANLSDTIRELAEKESARLPKYERTNQVVQLQVEELREDFPQVSAPSVYALLNLARNIPSAAWELIDAMTTKPIESEAASGRLNGVVQYAPVKIDEGDDNWTAVQSPSNINLSANHSHAAGHAFAQASAAARRAKSDRLMGGAAAYYAAVGHEHMKFAKAQTAAAADALVTQQSSRTMIDLHGVSVSDAVRIANTRTRAWWDGLGDEKFVSGGGGPARAGFQIVTGVGTHSRNNAPRIGPAVAKSLVREGWKVEVGHGEMYITGKVRR